MAGSKFPKRFIQNVPDVTVSSGTSEPVNADSLKTHFGLIATIRAILDLFTTTRGSLLFRGASGWTALGQGSDGQVLTSAGAGADPAFETLTIPPDDMRTTPLAWTDFLTNTIDGTPFSSSTQGGGAAAVGAIVEANHPGVASFGSSASTNSGYTIFSAAVLIQSGYWFEACFKTLTITSCLHRFGFNDTITNTTADNPIDGVYLEVSNATMVLKTYNNSTGSTSSTLYTLSNTTWYRVRVEINSASLVTGYIYSESGTLLASTTLTTNIPIGTGRGAAVQVLSITTNASSKNLIGLDYMAFGATLTR